MARTVASALVSVLISALRLDEGGYGATDLSGYCTRPLRKR